jgi:hypothetical protein
VLQIKATPGTTSPAGVKRCMDSSNSSYLVASYDFAGQIGGDNPQSQGEITNLPNIQQVHPVMKSGIS